MVWEQAACVGPPAEVFLASLRPRLLSFFLEFDGVVTNRCVAVLLFHSLVIIWSFPSCNLELGLRRPFLVPKAVLAGEAEGCEAHTAEAAKRSTC